MNRATLLALVALACALAACTAPPERVEHNTMRRVHFACDNGEDIEMRFFPAEGVAVLVRGGHTMELQQQPSASGFVYSNGPNTVRGKGDALRVEIGRRVPIHCQARPA